MMAHPVVMQMVALKAWMLVKNAHSPPASAWEVFGDPRTTFSAQKVASAVALGDLRLDETGRLARIAPDVAAWVRAGNRLKMYKELSKKLAEARLKKPLTPKLQRMFRRAAHSPSITLDRKRDIDLAERLVARGLFRCREPGTYSLTPYGAAFAQRVLLV